MPTITPVARAVIGASTEEMFRRPTTTVNQSTGMDLPALKESKPESDPTKVGQSGINEETGSKAVTLSPQLTALARRQQKLQQEIQAQRDKEAAFTAKESDYIPKTSFKSKLQENAVEALKDLGIDYEEITNLILAQQQGVDPLKEIKDELKHIKSAQEQNVSKQYEATINQYKKEIETLVESNADYITVKEEKAQEAVLQHILDTFKSDNTVLTVEEASKDIEEFLVEQALSKTTLTKVKAKLAPEEKKTEEKKLPPPASKTKTLTQQIETVPTRTYNQSQHLSPRERLEQAIVRAQATN